ncbi:phage antirepressor KilAC domain-containing protein [Pseudomonas helleri]|uniref:phage antirepressor KilAC domain-containing protein n=1 Tax=Pseudomonas helleri TaxID=1608996 RepID=UPI00242EF182|nr:phage antirepressor KilAC domain-containing protein [Pseudomonas helleri]
MERTLAKAAVCLDTTRPKLIKQMREKGLLDNHNLPAFPVRDREFLRVKDSHWYHAELGMQYSQSTRVRQPGLAWLAEQLGLALPPIPADHRDVA